MTKLKLLSISCMVAEESLLVLINKMPFPELEVIKIDNQYMRTTTARLRAHCRLPHLKKLNLKRCAVKLDAEALKICRSHPSETQILEQKSAIALLKARRAEKRARKAARKEKTDKVHWINPLNQRKFLNKKFMNEESDDSSSAEEERIFESSTRQLSYQHNRKIDD